MFSANARSIIREARGGKGLPDLNRTMGSTMGGSMAETGGRAVGNVSDSQFFVMCTGQIEFGEFPGADNLYCRYTLTFGHDWYIIHGPDTGLSQIARKSGSGQDMCVVWNFPIDITFKSTNAFGWPRLAISVSSLGAVVARRIPGSLPCFSCLTLSTLLAGQVFAVDSMGRAVVVGYGSCMIPSSPGMSELYVHTYAPQPSSMLQQLRAWFAGAYPEFFDSKFVARGEGREVTRVKRTGVVRVALNVTTRGMASFGYNVAEPSVLVRPDQLHGQQGLAGGGTMMQSMSGLLSDTSIFGKTMS